mgnify:CR=1 FL=1
MLPAGFLGTRGDILMDLVVLSFVLILPLLLVSWRMARRGEYTGHRAIQLSLATALLITVGLFEFDMKMSGGIFALTAESRYAGTGLLNSLIYGHMLVAIASTLLWVPLVIISLRRFPNPPASNGFGARHRFWGRTGMILMMLAGLSAVPLYYVGFAL